MKIPVIAIKKIKPYVSFNPDDNRTDMYRYSYNSYRIYLEIELTDKWKNIFSKFNGDFKIQLRYISYFYCKSFYRRGRVVGITIKDFGNKVPSNFYYKPEYFSINLFKTECNRNRIIKCIKKIKFNDSKDLARIKMVSRI